MPSTFKSAIFSSWILPMTVCSIVQIVVLVLKHFYAACLWRSLKSFYNDVLGSQYFSKKSQTKKSPESLFGKITGFFFVICWPGRWKTLGHWTKLKLAQFVEMINWSTVFNVTSQAWHKVCWLRVKQFQMWNLFVLFFSRFHNGYKRVSYSW